MHLMRMAGGKPPPALVQCAPASREEYRPSSVPARATAGVITIELIFMFFEMPSPTLSHVAPWSSDLYRPMVASPAPAKPAHPRNQEKATKAKGWFRTI